MPRSAGYGLTRKHPTHPVHSSALPPHAAVHRTSYEAAYSGFEGADEDGRRLAARVREHGITAVDVVGIATDHCVKATVLDVAEVGFATQVLLDLTAA